MNKTKHIVNNNIGGVSIILNEISDKNDIIETSDILKKIVHFNKEDIYVFHQPKSHLWCLLLLLALRVKSSHCTCILHESSDYNYSGKIISKGFFAFLSRLLIIKIISKLNVKILGVSNYVLSSYCIKNGKLISYLNKLKPKYDFLINYKNPQKKNECTAWLRNGDDEYAIKKISKLIDRHLVSHVNLFGDSETVYKVKLKIKKNYPLISFSDYQKKIDQREFHEILIRTIFFISPFRKEGFGLSLFEAMCAGCICLTPYSGGPKEWLPLENFKINDLIDRDIDIKILIDLVSNKNRDLSKKMIGKNQKHS